MVRRGHESAKHLLFTTFILRAGGTSMLWTPFPLVCRSSPSYPNAKMFARLLGQVLVSLRFFNYIKLFSNLWNNSTRHVTGTVEPKNAITLTWSKKKNWELPINELLTQIVCSAFVEFGLAVCSIFMIRKHNSSRVTQKHSCSCTTAVASNELATCRLKRSTNPDGDCCSFSLYIRHCSIG